MTENSDDNEDSDDNESGGDESGGDGDGNDVLLVPLCSLLSGCLF